MQLADGTSLQVMGRSTSSLSPPDFGRQSSQSQEFSYTGTGARPMPMLAANYRAPSFGGSSKKNKATAKKQTKPTLKREHRFTRWDKHVHITEDTANVTYIISKVRESFRDERLELFTTNGLKVFDTGGTRGMYRVRGC